MRKYVETTTKTVVDLDGKKIKEFITDETYYVVKTWDELTRKQKEEQIEKHCEDIEENYHDMLQFTYECDLEDLKKEFKEIGFDYIYLDSNSQGAWIDCIKDFRVDFPTIEVYGEIVELRDVDYMIRKYIENVEEKDLWFNQSYIECETWEKIIKTKKFKNWVQDILTVVNKWIDRVDKIVKPMFDGEYYYPSNLDNIDDVFFLDNYFSDTEFTYKLLEDENGDYTIEYEEI